MLISAQNISLTIKNQLILDNVSLDIKAHDFITIVGPNGAGKSSLIKTLIGMTKPSQGAVVHKKGIKIGYIPQDFSNEHLLPLSAQNFLRLKNPFSPQALKDTLALLSIPHKLLNKPIHVLSGGERQKLLLARALLKSPDVLILDEPAQNLDLNGQLAFYRIIEDLYHAKKCSIVMVSHDLHLVMASSQKVVCLYQHICCSGSPEKVVKDPQFVALFGQGMANMMAVYHHEHDHSHSLPNSHSNNNSETHGGSHDCAHH